MLKKGKNRCTTVYCRGDADHERPHHDQEVRRKHIDNLGETSNLLKDVKSVTLYDVCCAWFSRGTQVSGLYTHRVPSRQLETIHRSKCQSTRPYFSEETALNNLKKQKREGMVPQHMSLRLPRYWRCYTIFS